MKRDADKEPIKSYQTRVWMEWIRMEENEEKWGIAGIVYRSLANVFD